jgi:hypothetical protein
VLAFGGAGSSTAAFRLDNVRVNPVGAGDVLTYSLVAGPAGATIDPISGRFRWTAPASPGTYDVTVGVADDRSTTPSVTDFAITVLGVSGVGAQRRAAAKRGVLSAAAGLSKAAARWGDGPAEAPRRGRLGRALDALRALFGGGSAAGGAGAITYPADRQRGEVAARVRALGRRDDPLDDEPPLGLVCLERHERTDRRSG